MRVRDFMSHPAVAIAPDRPIAEAAQLMLEHRVSGLPVVDATGRLVGIVSEHDLLRRRSNGATRRPHWLQLMTEGQALAQEPERFHALTVGDVMTTEVVAVSDDTSLEEAGRLIEVHGIKRLPVIRDGRVIGVLSRADLLRALARAIGKAEAAKRHDAPMTDERLIELERQYWLQRSRGTK